jgi:hypothetical protein
MFATLWYAGAVVLVMGSKTMTLDQCNDLKAVMMEDIKTAYQDPNKSIVLEGDGFFFEKWKVTCEQDKIDIQSKGVKRNE